MELCEVISKYSEDKLYNIIEVKEKFKDYFGMSIEEMVAFFSNYNVIQKEEILNYLKMEYKNYFCLEEVVNNRMLEYDYHNKVLKILSFKGISYLMLINYLCDCREKDQSKEKVLEDVQIYHYSSIVTGSDINRLLVVMFHLLKKFNSTLETVNNKQDYLSQRLSSGMLKYEMDELYPSENLMIVDDYFLDKTSLKAKVRTR